MKRETSYSIVEDLERRKVSLSYIVLSRQSLNINLRQAYHFLASRTSSFNIKNSENVEKAFNNPWSSYPGSPSY